MSPRAKIITIFVIIVALGSGAYALFEHQNQIPQSFTMARSQGAAIAANIVSLSSQSTADLSKVNQLDEQGNYTQALSITTDLVTQSQQLRNQAVQLSNQVSAMTEALSSVNSFPAQQAALQAISNQLAIITQLVNYSNDLDSLLLTLQNHFDGKPVASGTVQTLVNQINLDVTAINSYNSQATQAMAQFDKITGQ